MPLRWRLRDFPKSTAAARIPLHRLNVNPLPDEAELRALLQLAPLPQRAPVFSLRGRAG
jgi:hypothetical protein